MSSRDLIGPVEYLGVSFRSFLEKLFFRYVYLVGVERENERLRKEVESLRLMVGGSFYVDYENSELRKFFSIGSIWDGVLLSKVVGCDPFLSAKWITIFRGKKDGIKAGDPVVSRRGLVGEVLDVGYMFSKVITVFSPRFSASCVVLPEGVSGVYRGGNVGSVDFVFSSETVHPGDLVFTSGVDGKFPAGIPIGVVLDVGESQMFKKIRVLPFLKVKTGMFVGIVFKG